MSQNQTPSEEVPRHVHGLHRSDLARIKDVVVIARSETAEGVSHVMTMLTDLTTTLNNNVHSLQRALDELTLAFKETTERVAVLSAKLEDLEARTPRGRWRAFVARVRSWMPQRITPEEYAEGVLTNYGRHADDDEPKMVAHMMGDEVVGHFRMLDGRARFVPNDRFKTHFETGTLAHRHMRTLDDSAAVILGTERAQ